MGKQIYIPEMIKKDREICIESTYFINYIKNVLRHKVQDQLTISNHNTIYHVEITKIAKKHILLTIKSEEKIPEIQNKHRITLVQSLFSWPRLEWMFEKSIELGVDEIIFVETERSKLKINNWKSKKERLEKIMYKALTQSHQARPIAFHEPLKLKALTLPENSTAIIFDTKDENLTFSRGILNNAEQDIVIAIGPEGGFSDQERDFFYALGFKGYKMPLPILRAETAAIASLVLVNSELNEEEYDR